MTLAANVQGSGELSLSQLVASMDGAEPEREEAAPAIETPEKETQNTEVAPTTEESGEAETQTASEEAETEEPDAETLPAIKPPPFWDAAAKERFGELPRDLQELVLAKEADRDRATSRAIQDAAEKRKAADGEASKLTHYMANLDKLIPQAVAQFRGKYDNVDWNQVIDTYGADQALKMQNDMRAEQAMIQQLYVAKEQATQVNFAKFVEAESAKLTELVPDLADPKLGLQRKAELGRFLLSAGVPADSIRNLSALETSIAYDAYQWRQAKANAKAQASAPPAKDKLAAPAARQSVRPSAVPAQRNPQSARIQTLSRKPSLTIDEAVELANLKDT